ncbi:MAG TPA: GvpL/GvpF family gas vesicle protein [Gaiellaceae bacterium]|nr:GvpL/GvpF family gas vesicle protein [Gaiellaceae bacterium]
MIHLYAFVAGLDAKPEPPLDVVDVGGLAAVVGPVGTSPPEPLRHGLVVEELRASAEAILPARYGEDFLDLDALRRAVEPVAGVLRSRLERLGGLVEVGVRVVARDDEQPDGRPRDGRAYLESRYAPYARRKALERNLHAHLLERARDARLATPREDAVLLDASYLVPTGDVESFARDVAASAAAWPELATVCTGPWAPYSFSEEG